MTKKKKPAAKGDQAPRRRRVGKLRGGKDGWEPRTRVLARLESVLQLHEQGHTQEEIARTLGISQAAVSRILHRADLRALAALDQQLAALKMRRLRILEYVSREGRRAWERSKQGRVKKRQRKATSPSGAPVVTHEVLVDEQPDPRMLEQARKAEEMMAEVCGFTGAVGRGKRNGSPRPDTQVIDINARAATTDAIATADQLGKLESEALRVRAHRILAALDAPKGKAE